MSKISRFARIVLPVACLLLLASGCKTTAAKGVEGLWQGTLKVPGGELRVVFHINKAADGKLSATLDSPDQGATGIPVADCSFSNGRLKLAVRSIAGSFEGTLKNDSTIEGTWTQGGASLPLVLKRIEKVEQANRPQEPKKPYPYKEEEVEFENGAGGFKLAGTLLALPLVTCRRRLDFILPENILEAPWELCLPQRWQTLSSGLRGTARPALFVPTVA